MVEAVSQETQAQPRYALDEAWLAARGRALSALVQERLCREARQQIGQVREQRAPSTDASGAVVFTAQRTTVGADTASLMALIAEHCAQHPEYRNPRLPVLEMVFRIFLARRNEPMTADAIAQALEDWVRPGDGRVLNRSVIERLMATDEYYGFRRQEAS
jgi:hypothetical protein